MRPWGPTKCPLLETEGAGPRRAYFRLSKTDTVPSIIIDVPYGTTNSFEWPETAIARLFCHAVLQKLPDNALSEAVESLAQIFEFYSSNNAPMPPKLPAQAISARWGQGYVRPIFPVDEDE
jgi:hypothetical protein